ncbi:hypothetical protein ABNQ24_12560 [Ralstonia pseudosolanacearum]|uniref:hypothetical protein n=1 Tax=Ralstonia pseudosolanacearum TaxID=1310165 RepID=UPI00336A449F
MSDRELLEKAAKAAGYEVEFSADGLSCWFKGKTTSWRPLFSDGDALRLAVKLSLDLYNYSWADDPHIEASHEKGSEFGYASEHFANHDSDRYAATRRAIVRAAAAIEESHE